MDFAKINNTLLVANAVFHAKSERKRMHIVLLHIAEIERRGIHAEYGYSNMCKFVAEVMGYGSKAAYERWSAAKLLQQVPSLSEKLEEGTINLTQVSQVRSQLVQDKKDGKKATVDQITEVFECIDSKSNFETKQILAQIFDRPIEVAEKVEPQKDGSNRFTTSFSIEMLQALDVLKALTSNEKKTGNIEELILPLVQKEIARIKGQKPQRMKQPEPVPDPSQSSFQSQHQNKNEMNDNDVSNDVNNEVLLRNFGVPVARKAITVGVWRSVMEQANYRCEYTNPLTGKKCLETHYLEIDHKIPVALGGSNRILNLQVLCRTHNQFMAKKMGVMKSDYDTSCIR